MRRNAKLPFPSIKGMVERKTSTSLLGMWSVYTLTHPLNRKLWGLDQSRDYVRKTLVLALYKDLFAVGYDRIIASVDIGFQLRSKTLRHNTKIIRKILAEWSRKQIVNEGRTKWDVHRLMLPRRKELHDVNLLIDSSDFRRSGKQSMSTKDSCWSFKLNGPAQRYTVIIDARGVVQKVWGGYSPKMYDGDWIKLCADDLCSNFDGAHIHGDVHYELGNRVMKGIQAENNVKFYIPFAEPCGRKHKRLPTEEDPSLGVSKLSKAQLSWNLKISKLCTRVESPFGLVKDRWESLGSVFFEDDEQQDQLVRIAFATHNWLIRHPR